jgi:hypothetical protein
MCEKCISYEIWLPYYKQGTDLGQSLENNNGDILLGLREDAERLSSAAKQLNDIANVLEKHDLTNVSIYADTHHIGIDAPKEIIEELLSKELINGVDCGECFDDCQCEYCVEDDKDFEDEEEE